jgi:stage II sporulation protein D
LPFELSSQITVQLLKVRIFKNEQVVNIFCKGVCHLKVSGNTYALKDNRRYIVKAEEDRIVFSGRNFPSEIEIIPKEESSRILVNNKEYRGNIFLNLVNGKISVINELDVEEYLYGVLPKEVVASWPEESLRAQAVISRTFALRSLHLHAKEGFNLCNTTHCQVYGGVDSENENTNRAVNETRGEVLFYNGKLASTFFHSSCGGHTENIEEVWGGKAPEYLKGRSVKYSNGYKADYWKNKVSKDFIMRRLSENGYDIGSIENIKMIGKTDSGRTKILKIYGEKQTIELNAAKFRVLVDPWHIKSTLFEEISEKGDSFEFSGLGWGHGVGLCQESAKNMADKGYDYEKILKYFYSGTYLAKWDEVEQ